MYLMGSAPSSTAASPSGPGGKFGGGGSRDRLSRRAACAGRDARSASASSAVVAARRGGTGGRRLFGRDEEEDGDVDFGKRDGVRRSRLRSAPPTAPTRVDATFGASARLSIRSREHESPARPRLRADE